MSSLRSLAAAGLAVALVVLAVPPKAAADSRPRPVATPHAETLPLRFEPNVGQSDGRVRFTTRTRDGVVFLTDDGATLRARDGSTVRIAPAAADRDVRMSTGERLPGTTSFLRGNDPSRWHAGIASFESVRVEGTEPGVDLVYYGVDGHLEYDLCVAPGADARALRLAVDGAERVELDGGDLILRTRSSAIRHRAPRAYQPVGDERRPVAARYVVESPSIVRFEIGAFDPTLPLVVDPEVEFSTFLGGADFDDAEDVAVDATGAVYVAGSTMSADFPTANPFQGTLDDVAATDAFVAKLAPDGRSLVYATYLGGTSFDGVDAIAVDANGALTVGGLTSSTDFPTASPFQAALGGNVDGFVARLAPDGQSLVSSTYLGGLTDDTVTALRVRADGSTVVGGRTDSADFPTAGAVATTFGGVADGFVAVLDPSGSTLVDAVFVGGDGNEQIDSIVTNGDGSVIGTGVTDSTAFAPCAAAGSHPFFVRLADGALTATAIGCDGETLASCFAAGSPSGDGSFVALTGSGSPLDVRVLSFDANGAVVHDTTFGGSGQDYPDAVAVGTDGSIYIAGDTDSTNLPTVDPTQPAPGGDLDGFVAVLDPAGGVRYASYLGGADVEFPTAVTTDPDGNVSVAGFTYSADFPTSAGSVQPALGGATDAFVVKIGAADPAGPDFSVNLDPTSLAIKPGQRSSVRVTIARTGGLTGSVSVTPASTRAIKVKITPASAATTGSVIDFLVKVKKKAVPGAYPIVFTGRGASGLVRTTTLTLTVL